MKLYLLRHGDSTTAASDNERPLSEVGRQDITRLAKFIAPLKLHVSAIFHSEKLRARETARIVSSAITTEHSPETLPELDPLLPVEPVVKMIKSLAGDAFFVGHMPFMGSLVSELTLREQIHDVVLFKTGTLVCLEQVEHARWSICWVVNPGLFV